MSVTEEPGPEVTVLKDLIAEANGDRLLYLVRVEENRWIWSTKPYTSAIGDMGGTWEFMTLNLDADLEVFETEDISEWTVTESRETPIEDVINHPSHYTSFGAEVIDITEHLNFNTGNAVKYLARADLKGDPEQDLRKALWYVKRELKRRGFEDG